MISFADNFLAGSLLTLLMPTILLSVIAIWYVRSARKMPSESQPARTAAPAPGESEPPPPPTLGV
jgi:hypothetical protein